MWEAVGRFEPRREGAGCLSVDDSKVIGSGMHQISYEEAIAAVEIITISHSRVTGMSRSGKVRWEDDGVLL